MEILDKDFEWLMVAVEEGRKGLGFVEPNPAVGCAIVSQSGELLSKGYHKKFGGPHAEVNALEGLDEKSLRGATVYVTLEPCAHEGKTPSCAKKLATFPIKRVVYGIPDPNPKVNGLGEKILQRAGIQAEKYNGYTHEFENLAEKFLVNQIFERPFVALKAGLSKDEQIFGAEGKSEWVTSLDSREHVHEVRGEYDAVLVGINTFLNDNPKLNSRADRFLGKENKVIVIDPSGRGFRQIDSSCLLRVRPRKNLYWVVRKGTLIEPHGVNLIEVDKTEDGIALNEMLEKLFKHGIYSVYAEGGRKEYGSLLNHELVDRVFVYQSDENLENEDAYWLRDTNDDVRALLELSKHQFKKLGPDRFYSIRLWK